VSESGTASFRLCGRSRPCLWTVCSLDSWTPSLSIRARGFRPGTRSAFSHLPEGTVSREPSASGSGLASERSQGHGGAPGARKRVRGRTTLRRRAPAHAPRRSITQTWVQLRWSPCRRTWGRAFLAELVLEIVPKGTFSRPLGPARVEHGSK
jgi:hypothetical protein